MSAAPAAPPTAVPETRRSRPAAAAAIERELQTLWRDEADARKQAAPASKPVGRSLLHTLVVFAPDANSADKARAVTAELTRHQPSRSILLAGGSAGGAAGETAPPAEADALAASVALHCVGPMDGRDTICCEQVTFAARTPVAQRRLPGAVLPLLLTDVPSFLWWTRGNPFQQPVLRGLEPAVDRLIIDSLSFTAPAPDLAAVAAAMADPAFRPVISDLSWARLAPWRYQTAQIFDPANRRPYLNRIVRARLNYYAGTPTLAWLFGGWLASRLGWQAADNDPRQVRCRGGQVIDYVALPAPDPAQAGFFAGVLLSADDGSEFEVARVGGGFIATRIRLGELHLDRVVPMRDETVTEWLGHELGRLAPTPTYEAALRYLVDASRAGESFVGEFLALEADNLNIRPVREEDIEDIIQLFRANYGDDYFLPEFYDPIWVKRGIYSDHIIWLGVEEDGRIVGSGALILNTGDYNDQIGEIGRLVVDPEAGGKGLGGALLTALVDASDDRVDFAFAEARTVHPKTQKICDRIGLMPLGFLPLYYQMTWRESWILSGQLFENGRNLRKPGAAQVVPEIAPLARLSLRNLELPEDVMVAEGIEAYPGDQTFATAPLTGASLVRLLRIEHGRLLEPEIFSAMHIDLGFSQLRSRKTEYLVASDGERTLGAVGCLFDERNKSMRITELIAQDEAVKGSLLRLAVESARKSYSAELIKVDVSAESPRMQRTALELGFLPAAYIPGMVFHQTHRPDVIKMLQLTVPYEPGPLVFTEPSREVYELVAPAFERATRSR